MKDFLLEIMPIACLTAACFSLLLFASGLAYYTTKLLF